MTFNTLYTSITNAYKANKVSDVYYYFGKLLYLIVYFDPIEEASLQKSIQTLS